jgi:3-phosphoshikimate 1-carboxyvinyltransferase
MDSSSEMQVALLAKGLSIKFDGDKALLDGEDVSDLIRSERAGMDASRVAALPEVRAALLDLQKSFRQSPGLVADGRDMGTVVFPDSEVKIFLTASAARRAERRHRQLMSRGVDASLQSLRADLEARDARDSLRSVAPLVAAADANLMDNSDLSIEESISQVLSIISALVAEGKIPRV